MAEQTLEMTVNGIPEMEAPKGACLGRPTPAGMADDAVVAPHDRDAQVLVLEADVEAVDLLASSLG